MNTDDNDDGDGDGDDDDGDEQDQMVNYALISCAETNDEFNLLFGCAVTLMCTH